MRSLLQKECDSKCPLCANLDVEHFQAHHIDGDRSKTVFENLLLICPNCHSKIEKGDISQEQVESTKKKLRFHNVIEIYKIGIDSKKCRWVPIEGIENAFRLVPGRKSSYPILQISFINHFNKTIVLKGVELVHKHLFSGFSGLPRPTEVPKGKIQRMILHGSKETNLLNDFDGIQIGSEQAFTFQLELMYKGEDNYYTLDSRMILNFVFKFSNNITIDVPRILMNTSNERNGIPVVVPD